MSSYSQILLTLKGRRFSKGIGHFRLGGYLRILLPYIYIYTSDYSFAFCKTISGKSASWTVVRSSGLPGFYHPLPVEYIHMFLA